ncbi:DUF4442 domain-containing protein [Spongiibacter sp. KMU-158]|uniref:DUF4442 domain-containing protein n=2 Tax=Spongiibacter pelagi TaxID=2760804 RepID=A0A927C151_9GAMM|nr:DUF4442 domain-containing protein [Spongiibacter pelagi]
MNTVLNTWQKLSGKPAGKMLFSKAVSFKTPYFSSISPRWEVLEAGRGVVTMRDTRRVHNHLGGVHAIALCNLAEAAAGLTAEVSMPDGMRWIPAGMQVRYLAAAKGKMTAHASMREIVVGEKSEVPVAVEVKNQAGEIVFTASIDMYVSPKKAR